MSAAHPPIFESYLVVDGKPLEQQRHVQRMREASGIDSAEYLQSVAKALPAGYHRLRINCSSSGELSSSSTAIDIPAIFKGALQPLELVTRQLAGDMLHDGHGGLKISDRGSLEAIEAETSPAVPLIIDDVKNLLETTRHSIFIVEGDTVVTPPSDGRILPGVTAAAVLELCGNANIVCAEEAISLDRALQSNGLFTTNPLSGIARVERLDGTTWSEIPAVVRTLHRLLVERWRHQLSTQSI